MTSQRIRADLVAAEIEEARRDAARAEKAQGRRRTRLRAVLLLVLAACGAGFLYLHPENLTVLAELARRARASRVAGAAEDLLARALSLAERVVAPDAPLPVPASLPEPSAAAEWAEVVTPAEPGAVGPSAGPALVGPPAPAPPDDAEGMTTSGPAAGAEAPPEAGNSPAPTLAPTPEATPPAVSAPATPPAKAAAEPAPKPSPPARRAALLSIGFDHRLKGGSLEVWVDGTRVVHEPLDPRVTRKVLVLEGGNGKRTLALEPGRHEVRVRIRSSGWTKTAETSAVLRSGTTRRLEIRSLRLSGKISLAWK